MSINRFPELGSRHSRSRGRILLICFFDPSGISFVYENIALWQKFSKYRIEVINLWPGGRGASFPLPASLDLGDYVAMIIHCTASYYPTHLNSLDALLTRPFKQYDGLKILMKQDEQVQTNRFCQYMIEKQIDLLITCVPPEEREKVYSREVLGDLTFLHAFTGYVSPHMRELCCERTGNRPIGISYRGSIQPLEFGRLGLEKRKIGYDFARAAQRIPRLKTDISSRWEDRIFGVAWFDFLANSKAVLGVESGSNLFDFTGEVAAWCRKFEVENGNCDRLSEEFYLKAHEAYLHQFEGNVNYAQLSPRHFEAAATRSAQVLYEGNYSGVLPSTPAFLPAETGFVEFRGGSRFHLR